MLCVPLALLAGSCESGSSTSNTIYEVNKALTAGRCSAAIELIEPLYQSDKTNNEVRMLRSSAYGCAAGINYFNMIDEFQTGNLVGNAFWEFSTRLFPSASTDNKLEAAWEGYASLMTVLKSGIAIPGFQKFNIDTENPGALKATYRTGDSNQYMIMMSLAVMGATQNRYGAPAGSYRKMADLPWNTEATVNEEACNYAAAVASFFDGVDASASLFPGPSAAQLISASALFAAEVADACDRGCQGVDTAGGAFDAACAVMDCQACPDEMKALETCMTDHRARCAAAGVVRFVNDGALGWLDGP